MNSCQTAPPAICLMGPTASGKTSIALQLAKQFSCDVINVDSAQVYRHMNIGTAKPSESVLAEVPHRLIDILDPWESYSAGDFCQDAVKAMGEIHATGRVPLLVGGTMLYFHLLQQGLADLPGADADLRAKLDARAEQEGWPRLHAELMELDPATAARLHPTDRQRIQRALEICLLTGEPASVLQKETSPDIEASYLNIGLIPSRRELLHEQIALRLQQMRQAGFLDEVRALSEMPEMSRDVPAMRSVGYRQLWACIAGEGSDTEAFEKALVATRRLAKRQLTWLRSWPDLHEVDCSAGQSAGKVTSIVAEWLDCRATAGRNS